MISVTHHLNYVFICILYTYMHCWTYKEGHRRVFTISKKYILRQIIARVIRNVRFSAEYAQLRGRLLIVCCVIYGHILKKIHVEKI